MGLRTRAQAIEQAGQCANHGEHFGVRWPRWNGDVLQMSVAKPFDDVLPIIIISAELHNAKGYVAGPWMPW